MSFGDFIVYAKEIAREAISPATFAARPMYGIGYVPMSAPQPREENNGHAGWVLVAGALVLVAAVDFAIVAHRREREEHEP